MDRQNRVGYKNTGGPTSTQDANIDRRERLRKLAMESIDLSKDPYFMRNHVGSIECRLCLTVHTNESSYLAHTQGKKHQVNLARRQLREKQLAQQNGGVLGGVVGGLDSTAVGAPKRGRDSVVKIGRPGYRVTKQRCPKTKEKSLLLQVEFPSVDKGCKPAYRVMSAYEQKVSVSVDGCLCGGDLSRCLGGILNRSDGGFGLSFSFPFLPYFTTLFITLLSPLILLIPYIPHSFPSQVDQPPDSNFQYLLVACAPYETIGFKIPAGPTELNKSHPLHHEAWDSQKKVYTLQVFLRDRQAKSLPALPEQVRTTNLTFYGAGGFMR